ncbi:tripartite tricarboxylate transporter substrate binding protein [Ramlibacter sp. G-1-2-2]|uniref:Tripartite tricarboxylate transporter substrate binding protein n=1 Tax=Ramlibacter agri TaxID=2728837 RepID=A0A848HAT3_9BURK|nr:tripartite tricarboxylate transporter substrate binding protein [Ramlibacter agri]
MTTVLRRFLPALMLSAVAAAPGMALAAYPEQPIKMIVSYAPGGGSDMIARLTAQYMAKYLGNNANIVVVNHAGAGGGIGFAELARAPADGYTIGMINTPNVLTIPIERKSAFKWQDYDLLGNVVDDPDNISVRTDSQIKTLQDLVTYAKAHPGEVTYGTTGIGSDDHLAALKLEKATGIKMTHVPFKGASEVLNAVVSKQVTLAIMNIGEALAAVKGGSQLRQLGQMSAVRTNVAPNVPTFREQGFDIIMASLRGFAAPKGLPAPVREQLVEALKKTAADPEFQARASAYFAPMRYLEPQAYAEELKETEAGFRQLWQVMPWGEK